MNRMNGALPIWETFFISNIQNEKKPTYIKMTYITFKTYDKIRSVANQIRGFSFINYVLIPLRDIEASSVGTKKSFN